MIPKETIQKLRDAIDKFLMGTNNIEKLMRDKVAPYVLVEEVPVPIQIGKYTVWVGNLTINNNWKFWEMYGRILAIIGIKFENFDLLANGGDLYKALNTHKKFKKELMKLLYKTICKQQAYYLNQMPQEAIRTMAVWQNVSLKYFINNMSITKLIQFCRIVYIYNFDPEKKNLEILMHQLPADGKETMRSYMSSYLQNMVGLTGKFQLAQLIKPSPLSEGETIELGRLSQRGEMENEKTTKGNDKGNSKKSNFVGKSNPKIQNEINKMVPKN